MHLLKYFARRATTALITGAACIVFASQAAAAEYVSVIKDKVNVRTGPSTSDPVYMELFKGYPLKVVTRKGEWFKISDFESDTGWIHASLVGKNTTTIVSHKSFVNMRSGPGTTYKKVGAVDPEVILTKVDQREDWLKVRHESGTEGWIHRNLLWP